MFKSNQITVDAIQYNRKNFDDVKQFVKDLDSEWSVLNVNGVLKVQHPVHYFYMYAYDWVVHHERILYRFHNQEFTLIFGGKNG